MCGSSFSVRLLQRAAGAQRASALAPYNVRRPVPPHSTTHSSRCLFTVQRSAGLSPHFVLVADCRKRSLKKNRTSDKLELTLSDMSEVLLFFLFVSLPAVPAPAEIAPGLSRRALPTVRDAPALSRQRIRITAVSRTDESAKRIGLIFSGSGSRSCG